jgi:hypothetical protein
MAPTARKPCLAAAAFFAALALLIAHLAVAPLGAADLLGIAACAAAAGAFATLAFTLRPASLPAAPVLDPAALAEQISAAIELRLAASEDRRRDELLRAAQAAASMSAPADSRAPLSTDDIPASAVTAKPRLGRGLASLIHNPSALAKPAPAAPSDESTDDRAAA